MSDSEVDQSNDTEANALGCCGEVVSIRQNFGRYELYNDDTLLSQFEQDEC